MRITADDLKVIKDVYRLKLDEIGAMLGVSASYVCRIIRGNRSMTKRVSDRIVERFQLTPEKLDRIHAVYEEFKFK